MFNALTQFVVPVGTSMSYFTLYVAVLGVGGVYTAIYVLIKLVIPIEQVGGATVLIVTIGTSASLFAPLVVLFDSPVPFLTLTVSMAIPFIFTCMLPTDSNPESASKQEQRLIDGWNRDCQTPANLKGKNNRSSLITTYRNKKNESVKLYAAREGLIHAANTSMVNFRDTWHYEHQSYTQSMILAKRYHAADHDETDNQYLKV